LEANADGANCAIDATALLTLPGGPGSPKASAYDCAGRPAAAVTGVQ